MGDRRATTHRIELAGVVDVTRLPLLEDAETRTREAASGGVVTVVDLDCLDAAHLDGALTTLAQHGFRVISLEQRAARPGTDV